MKRFHLLCTTGLLRCNSTWSLFPFFVIVLSNIDCFDVQSDHPAWLHAPVAAHGLLSLRAQRLRGGSGQPGRRYFGHIDELNDGKDAQELSEHEEEESSGFKEALEYWKKSDLRVMAWGIGIEGRMGDGTHRDSYRPRCTLVNGSVLQVSAGDFHSLALKKDGSVVSWGSNLQGQLGDATFNYSAVPREVVGLDSSIVMVAGGGAHSLALSCDGCVYAWGANTSGQVGQTIFGENVKGGRGRQGGAVEAELSVEDAFTIRYAPSDEIPVPVIPKLLSEGVMQVAAGNRHSLALMADGRVFAWGQNVFGQLGIGKNFTRPEGMVEQDEENPTGVKWRPYIFESLPMRVRFPRNLRAPVISVAAGGSHSLALLQDGTVMSWGSNDHGQLGNGKFTALLGMGEWHDALIPTESLVREEVVDVCAGYQHSLALLKDGRVMAWGSNEAGQLGVDDEHEDIWMHCNGVTFSPRPVLVQGLPARVVQVAAGFASSLAVLEDGRVFSWGANYDGQLGNGSRSEQPRFPLKIPSIPKGQVTDFQPLTATNSIKIPGSSRPQPVLDIFHPPEEIPPPSRLVVRADAGSSHCVALVPAELLSALGDKAGRGPEEYDWDEAMRLEETLLDMYDSFPDNWINASELKKRFPKFDFEPGELRPADHIDCFETIRWGPEKTAGDWRIEILPNLDIVEEEDSTEPNITYTTFKWKNITKEEAERARMKFPQQYRLGYGTSAPPPEMVQEFLDAARAACDRRQQSTLTGGSKEYKELQDEIRGLILKLCRDYWRRAANNAAEDFEMDLGEGKFEEARQWAREERDAWRKLAIWEDRSVEKWGEWEQFRMFQDAEDEPGRACEAKLKRVDQSKEELKIQEEEEEAKKLEEQEKASKHFCLRIEGDKLKINLPKYKPTDPILRKSISGNPLGTTTMYVPAGSSCEWFIRRVRRVIQDEGAKVFLNGRLLLPDNEDFKYITEMRYERELDRPHFDEPGPFNFTILSLKWLRRMGVMGDGVSRSQDVWVDCIEPCHAHFEGGSLVQLHGYNFDNESVWHVLLGSIEEIASSSGRPQTFQRLCFATSKTLVWRTEAHQEGWVDVQVFRNGKRVAYIEQGLEFIDQDDVNKYSLPIPVRYLGSSLDLRARLVLEARAEVLNFVVNYRYCMLTMGKEEYKRSISSRLWELLYVDPSCKDSWAFVGRLCRLILGDEALAQRAEEECGVDFHLPPDLDPDKIKLSDFEDIVKEFLCCLPEEMADKIHVKNMPHPMFPKDNKTSRRDTEQKRTEAEEESEDEEDSDDSLKDHWDFEHNLPLPQLPFEDEPESVTSD